MDESGETLRAQTRLETLPGQGYQRTFQKTKNSEPSAKETIFCFAEEKRNSYGKRFAPQQILIAGCIQLSSGIHQQDRSLASHMDVGVT